ncbi:MAG: hemerythrin domain-containing protein [Actinomycetota bacterium]
MTVIDLVPTTVPPAIAVDLYRDIHKGIRAELFALVTEAAALDPAPGVGRAALAAHVADVVELLVQHAEHEDGPIQPVLEVELPELAERIARDHHVLDGQLADLREMAGDAAALDHPDPRLAVHRLHLSLAGFTGRYLEHIDVEERLVMPALERAVGPDAVAAIHGAIISGIPPEEMARSLALMIPAMNVEDRVELLGGMRASAPDEVFAGVWSLTGSVLDASEHAELAGRLGLG